MREWRDGGREANLVTNWRRPSNDLHMEIAPGRQWKNKSGIIYRFDTLEKIHLHTT